MAIQKYMYYFPGGFRVIRLRTTGVEYECLLNKNVLLLFKILVRVLWNIKKI